MTFADAAEQVLRETGHAMKVEDIWTAIERRALLRSDGRTPVATLRVCMLRVAASSTIDTGHRTLRFQRHDDGTFSLLDAVGPEPPARPSTRSAPVKVPVVAGRTGGDALLERIRRSPNYIPGRGLRTLSVQQPWAWAILHGGKDIENRSTVVNIRGTIAVHASKSAPDPDNLDTLREDHHLKPPRDLPLGAVVGLVDIVGCTGRSRSPWAYPDSAHWELANAAPLPRPIPAKGAVGFWYWDPDTSA